MDDPIRLHSHVVKTPNHVLDWLNVVMVITKFVEGLLESDVAEGSTIDQQSFDRNLIDLCGDDQWVNVWVNNPIIILLAEADYVGFLHCCVHWQA